MTPNEAEAMVRDAVAALQRGDNAGAAAKLESVTAAGLANAQIWMLLAEARKRSGDAAGREAALDEVLRREPGALMAMVWKGDLRRAAGDRRGATAFYERAVKLAEANPPQSPEQRAEVARAKEAASGDAQHYRAHMESALDAAGVTRSPRFAESLDLMFGEKTIYLPKPSAYYFPGLAPIQFFDRAAFPWVPAIEAATDAIREELQGVMRSDGGFRPYQVSDPTRPRRDYHGLEDNPAWSSLHLWENGAPVEENVRRCPRTFAALMEHVPLPRIGPRAPNIMFSWLQPGATIPPHHGAINARLICHLPLMVPPDCGFRVGNETREWREGEMLIFDDTIEHEAWNRSDRDRVVLIFDCWRPELSEDERAAVTAMFEAVDAYR